MPTTTTTRARYLTILALASGAILLVGGIFRPRPLENGPAASAVSSTDILRLQSSARRRSVESIAEFFSDAAQSAARHIVRLRNGGRSGVVWDSSTLVSAHAGGFLELEEMARPAPESEWRPLLTAGGPHLPLAAYSLSPDLVTPRLERFPAQFYNVGNWALAVWRGADDKVRWRLGNFLGSNPVECGDLSAVALVTNLELTTDMLGAGVFDVDGALMGVVSGCDGELTTLDSATAEAIASRASSFTDHVLARFGLRLENLDPRLASALGSEYGVVVTEVWKSYAGYEAGFRPGDVIVELDEQPVTAAADLELLKMPVAREVLDVVVKRGGRSAALKLRARGGAHSGESEIIARRTEKPGVEIARVPPESSLARAGVRAGDRLRSVDRRPATEADPREALKADSGAVYAVFENKERLWGAWLNAK